MKGGLLLNTLTFISCVALIQNGAYIDFVHLKELLQQMSLGGVSQARLQQLLILGKFNLEKVRNVRIWRLHPSVPYKVCISWPVRVIPQHLFLICYLSFLSIYIFISL